MSSHSFGQPVAQTHPHLLSEEEVVPGIRKTEFKLRRTKLFLSAKKTVISKDHIMIFPSSTKSYMSYDIPYPFRQNTEFLYLCGFQEPDSLLVLHNGHGRTNKSHISILFVPKKEPKKELWDGPRSGDTGAKLITGVDQAKNFEDLEEFLYQYSIDHENFVVWYNVKPSDQSHGQRVVQQFLAEKRHADLQNPINLIQQLRVIKSDAEIGLMRESNCITSEAFVEVMKFSHAGVSTELKFCFCMKTKKISIASLGILNRAFLLPPVDITSEMNLRKQQASSSVISDSCL